MTRPEVLDKAKECVCGQREQDYGSPEDNFRTIADLWTAYFGKKGITFSALDVAMMMSLLKIARISTGTATDDSFVDLAGYASCGCEIAGHSLGKASPHKKSQVSYSEFPERGLHRAVCGYDDIIFRDKGDAEKVLDGMRQTVMSCGCVSIADMYELAGIDKVAYTYNHFGWTSLDDAAVKQEPNGYSIALPRPHII